ncbi:hypothetical protein VNO77_19619 [Canavalia gladiata]|uniref:Receptor-like serine/threonine-protein kinase n=1 Tax=Canavalia gladiata TaxID=3824 RepID=A0AAN9LN19_CANGL
MGFSKCINLLLALIILCCYFSNGGVAIDTITSSQFIKDPETLSSIGGKFTLGFFNSPDNFTRHVGIWWQPDFTIVWVANRNQPLRDSSGIVTVSEDGNLVVLDGQKQVLWSSNVSNISSSNSSFQLTDYGNLILLEKTTGDTIWESFQHPCNTIMPNMKLGSSKRTGEKVKLTSWKTHANPSPGNFSFSIERLSIPEVFIWNGNHPHWRSGPWNGKAFTGLPMMNSSLTGIHVGDEGQGNIEYFYTKAEEVDFIIHVMRSTGNYEEKSWDEEKQEWQVTWNSYQSECDVYGVCGPFATCNSQSVPICSCLRGFEPKNREEWNTQNWTGGCVRRTPLQCERTNNPNTSADNKADGFLKLQMIKVPDFADGSSLTLKPDACRSLCLGNCFCVAYSFDAEIGCMSWTGNLIDIQQFSKGGLDLYIRVAHTELDKERNMTVIITITVTMGIALIITFAYILWRRISNHLDLSKNKFLDWRKRFSIIQGVARGLVYLHRDSRLKIIHRDLKASNILLDEELNPKISDFGMARIFGGSEDQANTRRVVGTYGYMSPEYAMQGLFSDKSDVFSFGVLLLEIVSGRRNSSFYDRENSLTLLGFAWIQWTENNISSLIDARLCDPSLHKYIFRCIHIGLLCVQEFATDRPTMATVISMLNSEIVDLPPPRKPAFVLRQNMLSTMSFEKGNDLYSLNSVSISDIEGR